MHAICSAAVCSGCWCACWWHLAKAPPLYCMPVLPATRPQHIQPPVILLDLSNVSITHNVCVNTCGQWASQWRGDGCIGTPNFFSPYFKRVPNALNFSKTSGNLINTTTVESSSCARSKSKRNSNAVRPDCESILVLWHCHLLLAVLQF